MARKGNSLQSLINETPSVEQLAWNHNADISASVYKRMRELNITQGTLAKRMKMHPSQLSRLLSGEGNITVKTIARLETALSFRLDSGFVYIGKVSFVLEGPSSWSSRPCSRQNNPWQNNPDVRRVKADNPITSKDEKYMEEAA